MKQSRTAAEITAQRRQAALYTDKVVQQTAFANNVKGRIILEGGVGSGAMTHENFYGNRTGGPLMTIEQYNNIVGQEPVLTPPVTPTNIVATQGDGVLFVSFTVPSNGGSPIQVFNILLNPGGTVFTTSSAMLKIPGLQVGQEYQIQVQAVTKIGASSYSDSISQIVVSRPQPPLNVVALAGDEEATITFDIPQNTGALPILSYTVTASDGSSIVVQEPPVQYVGLTNKQTYTFQVKTTNQFGDSALSDNSNVVMPDFGPVPETPQNVVAISTGDSTVNITFSAPESYGQPILYYTITYNSTTVKVSSIAPPNYDISGLICGTQYLFEVTATTRNGSSASSQSVSVTPGTPLAPIITSAVPTHNSIILNFTQGDNGTQQTINYAYSLNSGPFIPFDPADPISPLVVSNLLPTTSYIVQLSAINSVGQGQASPPINITTYTEQHIVKFSNPGTTTWTVPEGITAVEYLIVGGGGGSGGCYSQMNVIGSVPIASANPGGTTTFWINSTPGAFYGYLFQGNNPAPYNNYNTPSIISVGMPIKPSGAHDDYNQWYASLLTYSIESGVPMVTNYLPNLTDFAINNTYCNNISGGSGGGAGGQVITNMGSGPTYPVIAGQSYSIFVGNGGTGGSASIGEEMVGSAGESSQFDVIVAEGGSGGSGSHTNAPSNNGYRTGGKGGQSIGFLLGGDGGQGSGGVAVNSYGMYNTGGIGGIGVAIDLDGEASYGNGGNGGIPNSPNASTTIGNIGKGGDGTGATLNSYANGNNGGSGVVYIVYYT